MLDSFSWIDWSFITASCLLVGALCHRKRQNNRHEHENRVVQEINRIDAHSSLMGFIQVNDARNFPLQPNCSPFVKSIGNKTTWTFNLCETFSEAVGCLRSSQGTNKTSAKKKKNSCRINVPSQWQFFNVGDIPSYRCVSHIQEYNDLLNNKKKNPSGYYCHHFVVPHKWETRQVRLVFEGVDCAFYVWVNNLFVGFSKDSRLPAEFDITEAAKFKEKNCVEVIVVKYSDAMLLENHSSWRLNGIFRDVHLISLPRPVCISDFCYTIDDITNNSNEVGGRYHFTAKMKLNWDLSSTFNEFGQESTSVYPRQNFVATSAEWILSSYLYHEGIMVSSSVGSGGPVDTTPHYFSFDKSTSKPISKVQEYVYLPTASPDTFPIRQSHTHNLHQFRDGKTVEEEERNSHLSLAVTADKITACIMQSHEVKAPKLWSAERPNVYTLVMTLQNTTDGSVVQAESCRVAFRSVDVNYGLLRVNSKPVMIRGTNLHEHDPFRGSAVSRRVIEADIQLMKRNNINAIRTANYPHAPWLYELCTLYGLYVIDEANICTNVGVGAGDGNVNLLADDLEWEKAYMLRLVRMYERDKVHACIIAWSLGSDSGYGRIHDKMANWIGDRDTSRLVMYEPASYGPRLATSANANINSNSTSLTIVKSKHKRANAQMATDILCPKYSRVSECIVLGNRYPDMPLILMEYSDLRGNSGGNLNDYWTAFNDYTRLQGGFLFSWSDQGLCMTNSRNVSYWGGCGHLGGVIAQTTTDPVYGRWGNNPPGQASPLGLYPESPLLKLAERNSIKGRSNDMLSTPFVNGMRHGSTPYPYIRYGSEKTGAAASCFTAGGLTWPDRGIQDKAIFDAEDAQVSSSSSSLLTTLPQDDKLSFSYPEMYGLSPPPLYHKSFYKLLFTTALSDDSLILSQAIAKPQLLEAKYCMTPFTCFIESVKVVETAITPVVLNRYNSQTATFEPMFSLSMDNCSYSQLKVSPRLNIINMLDHIDDLTEELSFDALLLCNGLVVCAATLQPEASAVVHKTYNEETGRPTFQELEVKGEFKVIVTMTNDSITQSSDSIDGSEMRDITRRTVCGIKCPEDILLVPYCKNDINDMIKNAAEEQKSENKATGAHQRVGSTSLKTGKSCRYLTTMIPPGGGSWSVVVLGRTFADSSWAPKGYPLGMKQCKISNKDFPQKITPHLNPVPISSPARVPSKTAAAVSTPSTDSITDTTSSTTATDDSKISPKTEKRPSIKRAKSLYLTPTGKQRYAENELPLACPNTSTGISISREGDVSEHSEERYKISVIWVESLGAEGNKGNGDRDILLRAVGTNATGAFGGARDDGMMRARGDDKAGMSMYDDSRQCDETVGLVEVRVSGRSGSLVSYQVDGVELLSTSADTDGKTPSCFQLHRAPTVVDRGGYLAAWQAVGMDKEFVIQPLPKKNKSRTSSPITAGKVRKNILQEGKKSRSMINKPVTGSTSLEFVQVDHVFVHQSSTKDKSKRHNGNDSQCSFGQGIACKWETAPATVDKGRVLLLLHVQQFVNDSRVRYTVVEVRSNGQEAFVHEIAKTFRLGRETLSPYSEKNQDSSQLHALNDQDRAMGMKSKLYLEYVKIRLWKVAFFPSSTIPYVDTLSIGPFGGLKYDEVDVDDVDEDEDEDATVSNGNNDIYSAAYFDSFDDNDASHLLSGDSLAAASKSLRKNDRHVDLKSVRDTSIDKSSKPKRDAPSVCKKPPSIKKLFVVKYCVAYLLDERATLLLHAQVDVSALPCPLPRIGLQLRLDPTVFSHANWLGYGPHENYPDRKFSCIMGVHGSPFAALGVPYMIPGENGARGGLEWLQLHSGGPSERGKDQQQKQKQQRGVTSASSDCGSKAGSTPVLVSADMKSSPDEIKLPNSVKNIFNSGNCDDDIDNDSNFSFDDSNNLPNRELVVRCSRPFSFSVLPYTTEQLSAASNTADLLKLQQDCSQACINIDPFLMGVGGDDTCSSCVHEEYLIHPDKYDFQLAFSARNVA